MDLQEFSSEFDILYNNIMSNQAPGLDEYEKSIFLTRAQEEIVKNYFNPKGNKYQEGFEDSKKRQMDFSSLIKVDSYKDTWSDINHGYSTYNNYPNTVGVILGDTDAASINYRKLPMIILNEYIEVENKSGNKILQVVPIGTNDYTKIMMRPYKYPLKNQAWRLISVNRLYAEGGNESWEDKPDDLKEDGEKLVNSTRHIVELIIHPNEEFKSYTVRYVKYPDPIILNGIYPKKGEDSSNYPDYPAIRGLKQASNCTLDRLIHPEILQRAVELAKVAYTGDLPTTIQIGQRTE